MEPARTSRRAIRMAVAIFLILAFSSVLTATSVDRADAATYRTAAFPGTWRNPLTGTTGGSVNVFANFGALSGSCANEDRSHLYTYYLESGYQAHLGVDLGAPAGAGVFAVSSGTVLWSGYNLIHWGTNNGGQILVQHKTTDGTPFVVTYGHVNPSVQAGATVASGQRIGSISNLAQPHLHLGLRPGTSTLQQPVIPDARYSGTLCNLSGNSAGMVDPLAYLGARRSPGSNIAIKNLASNLYVATELNFSGAWQSQLRAARTTAPIGGWERFRIDGDCKSSGGCAIVSLVNGRYVAAELNYTGSGYAMLRAARTSAPIGGWERFIIEGDCAVNCAIKNVRNGRYVAAELGYTGSGKGMLRAARTTAPIGGWERWVIN